MAHAEHQVQVKKPAEEVYEFLLDFQPRGLARLMDPMINGQMQSEAAALGRLKEVLEGGGNG